MIRIIVRACKERQNYINYIREKLADIKWCFDQKYSLQDTFLRAMLMAGTEPCIHLEEDILLTRNFKEKIESEIQKRPNEVIQFFSMRKDDLKIGSRYDYGRNFIATLCFYFPENYSKMLYDFYPQWDEKEKHPGGIDLFVAAFLKSRKEKYWIVIPNLVQHRVGPSLRNKRSSWYRLSKTFVDPI